MGDVSLVGIVDLMTGEKDPRNLMIVFSILKVVMVEWNIENHVEVNIDPTDRCTLTDPVSSFLTRHTTTSPSHSDRRQTILTVSPHKI